jgi:hypothetical protein
VFTVIFFSIPSPIPYLSYHSSLSKTTCTLLPDQVRCFCARSSYFLTVLCGLSHRWAAYEPSWYVLSKRTFTQVTIRIQMHDHRISTPAFMNASQGYFRSTDNLRAFADVINNSRSLRKLTLGCMASPGITSQFMTSSICPPCSAPLRKYMRAYALKHIPFNDLGQSDPKLTSIMIGFSLEL